MEKTSSIKMRTEKDPAHKWVVIISIVIPVLVAILFKVQIKGYDFSFLPPIYATINGITAVLLIAAVTAIKNKKRRLHEVLIKICMALSALFLAMYVAYHMTSEPTSFGGTGWIKNVYFFILITHIFLSVGVIPLVLFTFLRAWRKDFKRHRKLAKIAFPIWLYVAVTGVVVYLMISPYYT
jgi:putative membrane protein